MSRLLVMLTGLVLVATGLLVPAPPASADVPAFQSARNRQIKSFSIRYARLCPRCTGTWYQDASFPKATGKVRVEVGTYRILDENTRNDFYLVDVNASFRKRKGDPDWGWMDLTLRSIGKTRVRSASYTLGKTMKRDRCRSYPVNLGIGFMGVSAGTTAGNVRFCDKGSRLSQSAVSRGRNYHAAGLTGISSLQMQRYVRVPQGKSPRFRVRVETNAERGVCAQWSDGYHCWVARGMRSKSVKIGTTRQ